MNPKCKKPETVKLPEENKKRTPKDFSIFSHLMRESKTKITTNSCNQWGYIKLRNFCTAKKQSAK